MKRKTATRKRSPRNGADLVRSLEKGMMRETLAMAHKHDLAVMAPGYTTKRIGDDMIIEPAPKGLPLTPVQKLLRKHAMRKAIRAKIASEMKPREANFEKAKP